jgi:hypothetical protein
MMTSHEVVKLSEYTRVYTSNMAEESILLDSNFKSVAVLSDSAET